jgi:predicted Kef-type K+ transport protein
MLETVWIGFAFSIGLLLRFIGLPSLVGYLAAGFVISSVSGELNLPSESGEVLAHVSHLGVLLLLFTVGLKLHVRNLIKPEVIGGGMLHFLISGMFYAPAIYLVLDISIYEAVMLAIALSFSSTVLAAKVLEAKRELRAFHGRVAIGILVIQDLLALLVMSIASGTTPSAWALLVFGLGAAGIRPAPVTPLALSFDGRQWPRGPAAPVRSVAGAGSRRLWLRAIGPEL